MEIEVFNSLRNNSPCLEKNLLKLNLQTTSFLKYVFRQPIIGSGFLASPGEIVHDPVAQAR